MLNYPKPKSVGTADWALTLIKYRRLDKAGKGPPQPSPGKTDKLRQIASAHDQSASLIAELERVISLYAGTDEGHGFESQVLNAVKADKCRPAVQIEPLTEGRVDKADEESQDDDSTK